MFFVEAKIHKPEASHVAVSIVVVAEINYTILLVMTTKVELRDTLLGMK
jgi:hypothetical protein